MKRKALSVVLAASVILTACSTSWMTEALNILKVAAPAAVNVLTLISVFADRPVNLEETAKLKTDFANAEGFLTDLQTASASATPGVEGQLNAALSTILGDLSNIFSTAQISDSKKQAEITAAVSLIVSEISAVESFIPQAGPKTAKQVIPLDSKHFKKAFNGIISDHPELAVK